jgi:hypothetical protein
MQYSRLRANFVLPGACTSCNGSSCCSCCGSLVDNRPDFIKTFQEALKVFGPAQVTVGPIVGGRPGQQINVNPGAVNRPSLPSVNLNEPKIG